MSVEKTSLILPLLHPAAVLARVHQPTQKEPSLAPLPSDVDEDLDVICLL
jgi:hypothetical protein